MQAEYESDYICSCPSVVNSVISVSKVCSHIPDTAGSGTAAAASIEPGGHQGEFHLTHRHADDYSVETSQTLTNLRDRWYTLKPSQLVRHLDASALGFPGEILMFVTAVASKRSRSTAEGGISSAAGRENEVK
jgi:hypothetical protein